MFPLMPMFPDAYMTATNGKKRQPGAPIQGPYKDVDPNDPSFQAFNQMYGGSQKPPPDAPRLSADDSEWVAYDQAMQRFGRQPLAPSEFGEARGQGAIPNVPLLSAPDAEWKGYDEAMQGFGRGRGSQQATWDNQYRQGQAQIGLSPQTPSGEAKPSNKYNATTMAYMAPSHPEMYGVTGAARGARDTTYATGRDPETLPMPRDASFDRLAETSGYGPSPQQLPMPANVRETMLKGAPTPGGGASPPGAVPMPSPIGSFGGLAAPVQPGAESQLRGIPLDGLAAPAGAEPQLRPDILGGNPAPQAAPPAVQPVPQPEVLPMPAGPAEVSKGLTANIRGQVAEPFVAPQPTPIQGPPQPNAHQMTIQNGGQTQQHSWNKNADGSLAYQPNPANFQGGDHPAQADYLNNMRMLAHINTVLPPIFANGPESGGMGAQAYGQAATAAAQQYMQRQSQRDVANIGAQAEMARLNTLSPYQRQQLAMAEAQNKFANDMAMKQFGLQEKGHGLAEKKFQYDIENPDLKFLQNMVASGASPEQMTMAMKKFGTIKDEEMARRVQATTPGGGASGGAVKPPKSFEDKLREMPDQFSDPEVQAAIKQFMPGGAEAAGAGGQTSYTGGKLSQDKLAEFLAAGERNRSPENLQRLAKELRNRVPEHELKRALESAMIQRASSHANEYWNSIFKTPWSKPIEMSAGPFTISRTEKGMYNKGDYKLTHPNLPEATHALDKTDYYYGDWQPTNKRSTFNKQRSEADAVAALYEAILRGR